MEPLQQVWDQIFLWCYYKKYFFFQQHLEESELTGRKRFLALKKDQIEKVAEKEFENHLEVLGDALLPEKHPYYDRVEKVAAKILNSNNDIDEVKRKTWTVSVVDREDQNAFVLPTGNIFVFTGK